MKDIIRFESGATWKEIVGYCRVVRAGNLKEVAGTTANREGEVIAHGNDYAE